jgi:hypothetical protein
MQTRNHVYEKVGPGRWAIFFVSLGLLFSPNSRASLYYQDAFNYTAGTSLSGNSPWTNTTTGTSTNISIVAGSLTYTNLGGVSPAGNMLRASQLTGTTNACGTFATTATGGPVYFSFLMTCISTSSANGSYIIGLLPSNQTSPGGRTMDPIVFMTQTNRIGIGTANAAASVYGPYLTAGTTNLIVLKYNLTTTNASLYFNPPPGGSEPGTPDITVVGTIGFEDLKYVYLRSPGGSGIWNFDTFRIASTWGEVTPTAASPPSITGQPTNQTVETGANVNFTVTATGSAPLTYQWKNSAGLIDAGTNATLTLSNVTTNEASDYFVIVTNSYGSVTSQVATLTVNVPAPPVITQNPASQSVIEGTPVNFTVAANGSLPMSYQWYFSGMTLIPSATNATYAIANASTNDAGNYRAVVVNAYGSATSAVASLQVTLDAQPPTIDVPPQNRTVQAGGSVTFSISASGTNPLNYQWRKDSSGISPASNPTATNSTLSLSNVSTADQGTYDVVVANNYGSVTSAGATLTVTTNAPPPVGTYTVVAWNNLGMHCMDADFSVFSILPPYNVLLAQAIRGTNGTATLITDPNTFQVTYQASTNSGTSINTTSEGKGNFWTYTGTLFGTNLAADQGLPVPLDSFYMPGSVSAQEPMVFEATEANFGRTVNWFAAYGIPITPYDDTGMPNQYPTMRVRLLRADTGGTLDTVPQVVLPVSDEMDCKLCHSSGSATNAMPPTGWTWDSDPGRDYKLNILKLHDSRRRASFTNLLITVGYNSNGLPATVLIDKKPILCARCHKSEALPGSGYGTLRSLTRNIHTKHATVIDPRTSPAMTLNNENNRTACYACHPGSVTRCLRGAMGKAVAVDGTMLMQCQSCHGSMSDVGSSNRVGWVSEPNCQSCHVGSATNSYGVIRFTNALTNGVLRVPADDMFATNPNNPTNGASLYRFSSGHGGLQCAACHGSTHAEYPSSQDNDNRASDHIQGHIGVLSKCSVCHDGDPSTTSGGPHYLHPVGSGWIGSHQSRASSSCRRCHGDSPRAGTELSRSLSDQTLSGRFFWRGRTIGCYECHNGPGGSGSAPSAPTVNNITGSANTTVPAVLNLSGSGVTTWRIVSQPSHGTVALSGSQATYTSEPGFSGADTFTFCGRNTYRDSNLATGTVSVTELYSTNDGIPNWWRAAYFGGNGSMTDQLSCATCDPDGDGFDNYKEYVANTDTLDARYYPRIFAITQTNSDVMLQFTSSLGQRLMFERTDMLSPASWEAVASNVWGRTDVTAVTDTNGAAQSQRFYRARVLP